MDAQTHELTLWLHHERGVNNVEIAELMVAPDHQTMSLRLLGDIPEPAVWEQATLTLCAASDHAFRRFEGFATLEFLMTGAIRVVRCTLPQRQIGADERQSVRMPVIDGLDIHAAVRALAEDAPRDARVRDLSTGGCLIEMDTGTAMLWRPQQPIADIAIRGPDGHSVRTRACIRHVHVPERGPTVRAGIEFVEPGADVLRRLRRWVGAIEQEVALRSGRAGRILQECAPFLRSNRPASTAGAGTPSRAPMIAAMTDIAGHLGAAVIALRNDRPLPLTTLDECAELLCQLLASDRQRFLYALCCLHDQPRLLQHCIAVAGRLADLIGAEPKADVDRLAVVRAALVHDFGKALRVDRHPPADDPRDADGHTRMGEHVHALGERLASEAWIDPGIQRDVIECINERLDGQGYPLGLTADQLSPLARAAQVVDAIDVMAHGGGDRPAHSAMAIYRELYNQPQRFDRDWVARYIKRHGLHPVGSLVRFGRGVLGWVMALDDAGQPLRVRAVWNLAGSGHSMNDLIEGRRVAELGALEGEADARAYQLQPY